MADARYDNLVADSIQTEQLTANDATFTGNATFTNAINGSLAGSRDINTVAASTIIPDSYYVFISDGSQLRRIQFPNICDAISEKLSFDPGKSYLTLQDINGVQTTSSITPASDYLLVSKGGTTLNKIAARDALSNSLSGLQNQTTISGSEAITITSSDGAKKVDYNVLAKAIVEQYSGTRLAGSYQSIQAAIGSLNTTGGAEIITTGITTDYGTLNYKCVKNENFVGFCAQLNITTEVPVLSDIVKGLPSIGDVSNNTPILIFSTVDGYIPVELHRITISGNTTTGIFTRTSISSGRSLRMNFVYLI